MSKVLRLLAIEGHASNLAQMLDQLREFGFLPDCQGVATEQAFVQHLSPRVAVILAAHDGLDLTAFRALEILQTRQLAIPLIVVGGPNGADQAVTAMKKGATDYVAKQHMEHLGIAVAETIAKAKPRPQKDSVELALANSQYRKKAILKVAPDAILTFDGEGHIVEANPAAEVMFSSGGLVGRSLGEVIMASSLLGDNAEWTTWLAGDANPLLGKYVEIKAMRPDGRSFPAEVSMVQIPASIPPLSTCFIRDITDRKKLEAELERTRTLANEARLRNIIQLNTDGIVIVSKAGRIRFVNPAAEELLIRQGSTRIGDIFAGPLVVGQTTELTIQSKNGMSRVAEMRIAAIEWEGEDAFLASLRDVSERKRAQEAIERKARELATSEEALRRQTTTLMAILNSMADGVVVANGDGRIVLLNPAGEAMIGMGATSVLPNEWGKHYGLYYPDSLLPLPAQEVPLWRALHGEAVDDIEMVVRNANLRDGALISVNARPIMNGDAKVHGAVAVFRDITQRRRSEAMLRKSEEQFRLLFEEDLAANYIASGDGTIRAYNPAFVRMFGFDENKGALEINAASLFRTSKAWEDLVDKLRRERRVEGIEVECQRANGKPVYTIQNVVGSFDAQGGLCEIKGYIFDNSERKQLEEQFRHAQKMEAIGKLAGGVAHDFNNLLTVINGYSDMIFSSLHPSDPLREFIGQIKQAGDRAARLTSQLLAFSRKQVLVPVILDLNSLLDEIEKMLCRLIGEDVQMKVQKEPALWRIKADAGQLEQVILNIVVNARDAMPQGGRLTIETANVELKKGSRGAQVHGPIVQHVMLAITDTGSGMDEATKGRIFEPFFTTKGPEKGTGLGLATVYGIIKQSGGHIDVCSELGAGTIFKVYLPRVQEAAPSRAAELSAKPSWRGTETVLLVEDEDGVRTLARLILQAMGYKVLETRNGGEALLVCEQHKDPIDILVTDVVMPNMSGSDLAARLASIRPKMKVLFMSGYTDDAIVRHGIVDANVPFVQKPFSQESLAQKVRDVLDRH